MDDLTKLYGDIRNGSITDEKALANLMKLTQSRERIDKNINHEIEAKSEIRNLLVTEIVDQLSIPGDEIENNVAMTEYGYDSISFTELVNRLNDTYDYNLSQVFFIENLTLESAIESIYRDYGDRYKKTEPAITPVKINKKAKEEILPEQLNPTDRDPIAIVGMSCQFPGAKNKEEFWNNLNNDLAGISEYPQDRWNLLNGATVKGYSREEIKGGFLTEIDLFDHALFHITSSESKIMDPQQRLLLMEIEKAIQDSGFVKEEFAKYRTGVFIGAPPNEYKNITNICSSDPLAPMSVIPSTISNRISFAFNLTGPSECFETACSTSIVALHKAMKSIETGETKQAIVGAVNLIFSPDSFSGFEAMGNLTSCGTSNSFQANADGYIRSEGVGALILKPLSLAQKDGNHIYALLNGSGIAHGGKAISMTAPNPAGMKAAIENAFHDSQLSSSDIGYVEANGVAIKVSDEVEISSLNAAYANPDSKEKCKISSLKPLIGHCEVASGMAQIFKVVWALNEKILPSLPYFNEINPNIDIERTGFEFLRKKQKWESPNKRVAAIHSYGFGGINAHAIISEYSDSGRKRDCNPSNIFVFSSHNEELLRKDLGNFQNFLEKHIDMNADSFAYTLQTGRENHTYRLAFVESCLEHLHSDIESYLTSANKGLKGDIYYNVIEKGNHHDVLSGDFEKRVVKMLMKDRDYKRLALHWTKGGTIDWNDLYVLLPAKASLPCTEFRMSSFWYYGEENSEEESKNFGVEDLIRKEISKILGSDAVAGNEDLPLKEMGYTSLQAVQLKNRLEQQLKINISLSLLDYDTTMSEIIRKIKKLDSSNEKVENLLPTVVSTEDFDGEEFPLLDIQEAYLAGRKISRDKNGCHMYFEIEFADLEINRFAAAWNRLVKHHQILRTVISRKGQKVISDIQEYKIKVSDLRLKNSEGQSEMIQKIRDNMSHKIYDESDWPLFEIRISIVKDKYIVHFSIDELIIDANGLKLLLNQWSMLYKHMDMELPASNITYRDYVLAIKSFKSSERYQKDLQYWCNKLKGIQEFPKNIFTAKTANDSGVRLRLSQALDKDMWESVKCYAREVNISTSTFIMTVFNDFLKLWSKKEEFAIILTYFNKLPLHEDIDHVLGPFISTNIFKVEKSNGMAFEQLLKKNQRELFTDLDYANPSGIDVLRELKREKIIGSSFSIPVVFTSMVNTLVKDSEYDDFFKEISYMVTQTPQVLLDHQIMEMDGTLYYSWDLAMDHFEEESIKLMFEQYSKYLTHVIEHKDGSSFFFGIRDIRIGEITKNTEDMGTSLYEEFPLTEQQNTYLFAKVRNQKESSSQLYQEIHAKNIDAAKLEKALNDVVKAHPMLTVCISQKGTQRFTQQSKSNYSVEYNDYSMHTAKERSERLEEIADCMLHKNFDLEKPPYFELRVSKISPSEYIIHFAIDLLIADSKSIHIVLNQLLHRYKNEDYIVNKPKINFKDYMQFLRKHRKSVLSKPSIEYWKDKIALLPSGPGAIEAEDNHEIHFSRRIAKFNVASILQHFNISLSALLFAVYAEVLAMRYDTPFTVVVPCWSRLPVHKEIDDVVGDFTAMSWIVIEKNNDSFIEKVRKYHQQKEQDIAHSDLSGIEALRKRFMRGKEKLEFPVVFTDIIENQETLLPDDFKMGVKYSKTQGVLLDNISIIDGEELLISWDANTLIGSNMCLEEMFHTYVTVLQKIFKGEIKLDSASILDNIGIALRKNDE